MINSWISLRDDFVMGGPESENSQIVIDNSIDWSVVGGFYPNENQGGRTWELWSLYFPDKPTADQQIERLSEENTGQVRELGQWDFESGAQTESQYPALARYMPDGSTLEDVNLLAGQTPRIFS